MRHYSKFVLPRQTRNQLMTALRQAPDAVPAGQAAWRQILLPELLGRETALELMTKLLQRISEAVGQTFRVSEFSAVLHWGSAEEVPRHTDGYAKTCFLLPLRCTKTLEFSEGYERCTLRDKKLIRFNDHESHGLNNPHMGHFYLLTVTRDLVGL